jgi:hypothetical protein
MIRRWSFIKNTNTRIANVLNAKYRVTKLKLAHRITKNTTKFRKFRKKYYKIRTKFLYKNRARTQHSNNWSLYVQMFCYWLPRYQFARANARFQLTHNIFAILTPYVSLTHLKSRIRSLLFDLEPAVLSLLKRKYRQFNQPVASITNIGLSYNSLRVLQTDRLVLREQFKYNVEAGNTTLQSFTSEMVQQDTPFSYNSRKQNSALVTNLLMFNDNIVIINITRLYVILTILFFFNFNIK